MLKKIIVCMASLQVAGIASANIPNEARNTLNQIVWRLNAQDELREIWTSENKWIKNEKYYDSVVKVMGKAIADCVTDSNEFKDKKQGDIIWFDGTDPEQYSQANFNAVFLYNFIFVYMNNDVQDQEELDELIETLQSNIVEHYKTNYISGDIERFTRMLEKAKNDITKYDQALGLCSIMYEFKSMNKSYKEYNYVNNLAPYIAKIEPNDTKNIDNAIKIGIKPGYNKEVLNKNLNFTLDLKYKIKREWGYFHYFPILTFDDNKWNISKMMVDEYKITGKINGAPSSQKQPTKLYKITESNKDNDVIDVIKKLNKLLEGLIKPIPYSEKEHEKG